MNSITMKRWLGAAAGAVAMTLAAGCASSEKRAFEYMPDMVRDPAYKAFAPNPVTRDGLTLQRPVAGTIPRGYRPFYYGAGDPEAVRAGVELRNPYTPNPKTLEEGKQLFRTYCQVCHGPEGKGDGPISSKIPPPPAYQSARLMEFPQGRIFYVITLGTGKMPSYSAQLSADERWKIVTYVHTTLQNKTGENAAPGAHGEMRETR
ncbi:MAG TPA: cytochrome c [Candidatus Saccharimonadales bacterium]|nr:cytochrome c [Candidatus Saccharimonadales bacterium]